MQITLLLYPNPYLERNIDYPETKLTIAPLMVEHRKGSLSNEYGTM